jgi:YVTN family beta-propeller protein
VKLSVCLGPLAGCLLAAIAILGVAVAPADASQLYVVDGGMDDVLPINAATGQPAGAPIPVGDEPGDIAIAPDGKAYVANEGSRTLSVIDTRTGGLVGLPIGVGKRPKGIAISADSALAYVTNEFADTVSVVDLRAGAAIGEIEVGDFPVAVGLTLDGKLAYVANFVSNDVSVIDTGRGEVVDTIPVGSRPTAMVLSPDGGTVYVTNRISESVSVLPVGAHEPSSTIAVRTSPNDIVIAPDGGTAYVSGERDRELDIVDLRAGRMIDFLSSPEAAPGALALSDDGARLFVAGFPDPKSLSVIDTRTRGAVRAPIPIGEATSAIALVPNRPPTASFAVPSIVRLGAPLSFDAAASGDSDGAVASFAWDFGGGGTASGAAPTAVHTFKRPGVHTVTLTVADDDGLSATQSGAVEVVYPTVRVRCPRSAHRGGCKLAVRAVTRRHRGKPETAVTTVRARAGKTASVPLKPKPAFVETLGTVKTALIELTVTMGGASRASIRRLGLG